MNEHLALASHVLTAHRARLMALDPLLAEPGLLPDPLDGDALLFSRGGEALVRENAVDMDSFNASFKAAHDSRFVARVADPAALADLLDQWERLDSFRPGRDDSVTVTWPSRDTEAAGLFVDRGFMPETVLAVRRAGFSMPETPSGGVLIRRVREADREAVAGLWLEEIRWDQRFRSCVVRPSTEQHVRHNAEQLFAADDQWCWVAETDGAVVGMMVVQRPERAAWASGGLAIAPATYLTCGVVSAASRGGGVGYALVREVHDFLDAEGVAASLLHYAAVNPLSVPFWSRCGYRPLTTTWTRGTIG